ncbi:hypothetical protein [Catellatospora vulcania]|uniref:hypothetical protein n=1 Tax=Catellatospora vulcania TaxID=1460450 RepID=UPI0012D3EC4F|nr:hypothetical protein [Catellatospora vulcania]
MADINPRRIAGIVLAPVVCVALLVTGVIALLFGYGLTGDMTMDHADVDFVYLLGTVLVCALAAVAAYRIAGLLWARGWWALVAVLVPAVVFAILQLDERFGKWESGLVWLAGLAAVLAVASVLARRGLLRAAWIVGVLGVIVVADVAVLVQLWSSSGMDGEEVVMLDRAYAPLWLLFALADYDFGLDPASWHIGDSLDLREVGYPLFSMSALGYVVRAMRGEPKLPAAEVV